MGLGLVVGCLAGTAAAFASTGVGSAGAVSIGARSTAPGSTARNEQVARGDARRLLARAVLPPGATPTNVDPAPGATLRSPAFSTATPARVDVHRFWRTAGAPKDAIDWIEAHPPAGSTGVFSTGVSALHGVPYAWSVAFSFAPVPNVLVSRTVDVVATAASGGGTGLRADAEVVWSVARPRWERIPAGVRLVTITDRNVGGPVSATRTVTSRRKVGRIVGLIDRLPRLQPGFFSCPAERGPLVDLTFRDSAGSPAVAVASADGSGCGVVTLRIRGRTAPALSGAPGLIKALDRLLGVKL